MTPEEQRKNGRLMLATMVTLCFAAVVVALTVVVLLIEAIFK